MRFAAASAKAAIAGAVAVLVLVVAPPPALADKIRDAQWHLDYLKIAQAHAITKGAGVTVAVIDSGVDAEHPDLRGAVLPGANVMILKEGSPVGWTDTDGHGTAMAGVIAARGKGNTGALGIAPESKILPIRISINREVHGVGLEEALAFATAHGAKVISMSFVSPELDPIEAEALEAARAADIVLVAGVGNLPRDKTVRYPAAHPSVIGVGAVDRNGDHADLSVTGDKVELSAPGIGIMSPAIAAKDPSRYRAGSGTSQATAVVAGAAALVRAKYPQLTADQVVKRLTSTAIDTGPKGRDSSYGYGVVNVVGALTAPLEAESTPAAAPAAPRAASDRSSTGDGISAGVLAALGGGALLLIGGLVALVVLIRKRRSAA